MKIRFGIIGLGTIAKKFAQAVAVCEDVELTGVAARELARAEEFAKEYGAKKAYGSYLELMQDPEIDAIYITLPHNFHASVTKLCLEHGKAVLCEKPFVTNEKDATQAFALAKEKDVLLMEAMWTRCLKATKKAKSWLQEGKIGELKLVECSFSFYIDTDPQSRLFNLDLAGGGLLDVGVYCLEFIMGMADGVPNKVVGMAQIGQTGVDEVATVSLSFPNGVLANTSFGIKVATNHDAYLYGTKGKIVMHQFWGCRKCELFDADGELIEVFEDEEENGFVHEVNHFKELFVAGKKESNLIPSADTIACARIFDTLRKEWGLIE